MTVRQLQGNVLYEFRAGEAKVRPFVFGGIGATFFSAADLQSETKLSFDYGGGLKYFAWRGIGMRVHARFKPTALNDNRPVTSAIPSASASHGCHRLSSGQGRLSASETGIAPAIDG